MTQPEFKRPRTPKSLNIFDNLLGFSQPTDEQVQRVRSKHVLSADFVESVKKSQSSGKNLTTQIESIPFDEIDQVNHQAHVSTNEKSGNNSEIMNCVILPLILDKEYKTIKQPLFVKIKTSQLLDFGFKIFFDGYVDDCRNYFQFELDEFKLTFQIIAAEDSQTKLKKCFEKNSRSNPLWHGLKKIKKIHDQVIEIQHRPLRSPKDTPILQVLGDLSLDLLFKKRNANTRTSFDQEKEETDSLNSESSMNMESIRISNNSLPVIQKSTKDSTKTNSMLNELESVLSDLERKKQSLSDLDTTGSIIGSTIKSLKLISDFLLKKEQLTLESEYTVPEKDSTYKNSPKNQIFVEGCIEFELDAYESAVKRSKIGDPGSFAYQIIKHCFPESYFKNVTLGIRDIDRATYQNLLKLKEDEKENKFPLSFVWGFENPFSQRFVGNFNHKLGQARVRAFSNHLFRKSDIFRYSRTLENKVRSRIIKELNAKNTDLRKNQANMEFFNENSQNSDSQNEYQDADDWESDIFEDL